MTDAKKHVITMPLVASLGELKEEIARLNFGPLPVYQRIFHLGRELKTTGRSLSALGLGRHSIYIVHMFATQPALDTSTVNEKDSSKIKKSKRKPSAVSASNDSDTRSHYELNDQSRQHRKQKRYLNNSSGLSSGIRSGQRVEEFSIDDDDEDDLLVFESSTIDRHRVLDQAEHQTKNRIIEILDDDDGDDSDVAVIEVP
eukprot:CAMPEP_0194395162 /NCGR_PEP_ID=MMETSP0174-20130528/124266_1 /TAXON_ID=216777 /ORGANISM="Proboscia alata, Strain PI-D3" /LENGTH=199 /DNA_ID=CAMNT_0039191059 /DNA_START=587 /DNA_END=1186 /DNA_ORIENTATION=-